MENLKLMICCEKNNKKMKWNISKERRANNWRNGNVLLDSFKFRNDFLIMWYVFFVEIDTCIHFIAHGAFFV